MSWHGESTETLIPPGGTGTVIATSIVVSAAITCALYFVNAAKPQHTPALVGMQLEAARRASPVPLRVTARLPDSVIPAGAIARQQPLAGSLIEANRAIEVVVSTGVPDSEAHRTAETAAAEPTNIERTAAATPAADQAPAADPPAPTPAVAHGERVRVPRLRGHSPSSAGRTLRRIGLQVGRVRTVIDEDIAPGRVVDQRPSAGQQVARGTRIDLTVSSHEE